MPLPVLLARLLGRVASSLLTPALAGAGIVAFAAWAATCLALAFTAPAHAQGPTQAQALALAHPTLPAMTVTAPPAAPARAGVDSAAGLATRVALADPTRPPAAAQPAGAANAATSTATRGPAAPRGSDAAQRPAPPAALRLQSLHLPQVGAASALIDGQLLCVGDALRDWTVQAIRADGVLLTRRSPTDPSARTGKPARAAPESATGRSRVDSTPSTLTPTATLWLSLLPPLVADAPTSP
jgi:hypothetical protein